MNSRLYNRIYEHFKHLIPRMDLGAQERLAKNEEIRDRRVKMAQIMTAIKSGVKNTDGSIDIDGSVDISRIKLTDIRYIATFRDVFGAFNCSDNHLTSLEGAPQKCDDFYCGDNRLVNLKGGPVAVLGLDARLAMQDDPADYEEFQYDYVTGFYDCSNNKLTSLEGAPEVCHTFMCYNNRLTTLEHCPIVLFELDCSNNELTSFRGSPFDDGFIPRKITADDNAVSVDELFRNTGIERPKEYRMYL